MPAVLIDPFLFNITQTTPAADETVTINRAGGLTVYDGSAYCNVAAAGGTLKVQRQPAAGGGFVDMTDAVAVAVASALSRFGSIAVLQQNCAKGDQLKVVVANAAQGQVRLSVWCGPTPGSA